MKPPKQITGKNIGCVFDCSAGPAARLNIRTWELAIECGMAHTADDDAIINRNHYGDYALSDDDLDSISEMGDTAIDYLNGLELPPYCSFVFDDNSLFLMPSVQTARRDVGFVSGGDDSDPDDSDYPAKDFRGEWLHVNDHGNATLYARNESGQDVEIWSVV